MAVVSCGGGGGGVVVVVVLVLSLLRLTSYECVHHAAAF